MAEGELQAVREAEGGADLRALDEDRVSQGAGDLEGEGDGELPLARGVEDGRNEDEEARGGEVDEDGEGAEDDGGRAAAREEESGRAPVAGEIAAPPSCRDGEPEAAP